MGKSFPRFYDRFACLSDVQPAVAVRPEHDGQVAAPEAFLCAAQADLPRLAGVAHGAAQQAAAALPTRVETTQ